MQQKRALAPAFRNFLVALAVTVVGFGGYYALEDTVVGKTIAQAVREPAAQTSQEVELTGVKGEVGATSGLATGIQLPTRTPASADGRCTHKFLTIPWSGMNAIMAANGGAETTRGSLMDKGGLRISIARQDDYGVMREQLIKFANAFRGGADCPTEGAAMVGIMGDGGPGFANALQPKLKELGMNMEVVGIVGFSNGEDKCITPYEVAADPQKLRGILIGAVNGDGDMNLCLVLASANKIPVNYDPSTYDPNAMNFTYTASFIEAGEKYIAGAKEERKEMIDGHLTGRTVKVAVNGVATWTPGDVTVAQQKGGYSAASTRDFNLQMGAAVIGVKEYFAAHPEVPTQFLRAALLAGAEIQQSDAWLRRAAEVNADVYGENDADWWVKYYKGVTENDVIGKPISLGGSRVVNAAQARQYFGLASGSINTYQRVWNTFANVYREAFPTDYATIPPYAEVVNTKYLDAATKGVAVATTEEPKFQAGQVMTRTVGQRSWKIEFDTGRATFRPEAEAVLQQMLSELSMSSTLAVQVNGHTDDVGEADSNFELSRRRAQAVADWLKGHAPNDFPENRIRVRGFGEEAPISDNNTSSGRAENRRVEMILGSTS